MRRWMRIEVQGCFKRRTHLVSMIIVHVRAGQRCRAHGVESPTMLPTMSTRNLLAGRWRKSLGKGRSVAVPEVEIPPPCASHRAEHVTFPSGRWMKVHGQFERRAHIFSLISVHVGVGQRCRAPDGESPATLPTTSTRNVPAGRWMQVRRKFKMQADIISGVVMDIAAFKISHSVGPDAHATAL
eukprot:scaffold133318_cov72-Phaeocystis_antarctica.AAC.2